MKWVSTSDGRYGEVLSEHPGVAVRIVGGSVEHFYPEQLTPHEHDFVGPLERPDLAACACGLVAGDSDLVWGTKTK